MQNLFEYQYTDAVQQIIIYAAAAHSSTRDNVGQFGAGGDENLVSTKTFSTPAVRLSNAA